MAEDLGTISLEITADERQIQRAQRKAGEEQGRAFRESSGVPQGATGGGGTRGRPIITESGVETATEFGAGTGLAVAGGRIGGAQGLALKAGGFGFGGFESLAAGGLINFASTGSKGALRGAALTGGAGAALTGLGALAAAAAAVVLPFLAVGAILKKTIDTLVKWDAELQQTTRQLAPFSGAIMGAQIQSMFGQLQRQRTAAAVLGPSLARTEQLREANRQLLFGPQLAVGAFKTAAVFEFQRSINKLLEGVFGAVGLDSASPVDNAGRLIGILVGATRGAMASDPTPDPILSVLYQILKVAQKMLKQQMISSNVNSIFESDIEFISRSINTGGNKP